MRIGERLLREGHVDAGQLENAARMQARFGGRIGTALVELGYVDVDVLSAALGRHLGVPAAVQRHFDAIDAQVVSLLPARAAEKFQAMPLGWSTKQVKSLIVAFVDPRDIGAIDQIQVVTRARVLACVAPEARIRAMHERHYGIKSKGAMSIAIEPSYDVSDSDAPPGPGAGAAVPAPPKSMSRLQLSMPPPSQAAIPVARDPITDACRRLDAVTTLEEACRVIVSALGASFRVGCVLVSRQGALRGFGGFAPGVAEHAFASLAVPPSLDANHLHAQVCTHLRCAPGIPIALPILVDDRVVSVVYAHGDRAVDDGTRAALDLLCDAAGRAYARLLRVRATG